MLSSYEIIKENEGKIINFNNNYFNTICNLVNKNKY